MILLDATDVAVKELSKESWAVPVLLGVLSVVGMGCCVVFWYFFRKRVEQTGELITSVITLSTEMKGMSTWLKKVDKVQDGLVVDVAKNEVRLIALEKQNVSGSKR